MFASTNFGPSLNPFGPQVLIASLISGGVWLTTEYSFPHRERARGWVSILAPLVLFAFIVRSRIEVDASAPLDIVYTLPPWGSAEEYFACYIIIATALILAFKTARLPATDFKVLGFIEVSMALALLGLEMRALYVTFYA